MLRILLPLLLIIFYFILIITTPVFFGVNFMPLTVIPLTIAYAVFYRKIISGFVLVLLMGVTIDFYSGIFIGLYITIALLLWFGCLCIANLIGKPEFFTLFIFIVIISIFYRLISFVVNYAISGNAGSFQILILLWAPFLDGLIGIYLISLIESLLIKLKLADANLDVTERLSSRRVKGI